VVGAGKRVRPASKRKGRGLTETEVYAELVHSGVSIKEIAGLTDQQLIGLYFRPRDKYGRLKRDRLKRPARKIVPWSTMYRNIWTKRGLGADAIEAKLKDYLRRNPPRNRRCL
jgi:hypothetical protein